MRPTDEHVKLAKARAPRPRSSQDDLGALKRPRLVQLCPYDECIGKPHLLGQGRTTIGRATGCDLRLESKTVSRIHAQILLRDRQAFLIDQRSTNGCYVDGERAWRQELTHGARIQMGNFAFKFLLGDSLESTYYDQMYRRSVYDATTEIYNRRYLLGRLARELRRSTRLSRPLSALLIDIDHFSAVNDHHGHLVGDAILRLVARRLRATVRTHEILARYGGEEFVLVMPETDRHRAAVTAERLRRRIECDAFLVCDTAVRLTVSIGSATAAHRISCGKLLQQLDERMYLAKSRGRNQVVQDLPRGHPVETAKGGATLKKTTSTTVRITGH